MPTITTNQNTNYSNNEGQFIPVKVVDVVLDLNFPEIDKMGGWDALGTILFIKVSEIVKDPEIEFNRDKKSLISSNSLARPLFANSKYYPLKGEIVLIYSTLGRDIINDDKETYYIPNINIWNHPHHNALPNPDLYNDQTDKNKTQKDYINAAGGLVRQVQDLDSEIELGGYFREQLNVKPLLPFEGDHIIEGRFGNSIRFGATAPGPNDWSSIGQVGDPITIIRNGQSSELDSKGWEPTIEDINRDLSSIYLTSTQKLDKFIPASLNWQSWGAELKVIDDPIEALTSPTLEEYTEPEPTTSEDEILDSLIAAQPTGSVDQTEEEVIESEDNTPPPPDPDPEEEPVGDDLSLYDELLASDDFDEDDFNFVETETITDTPIGIDGVVELSAESPEKLKEIQENQTSSYRTNGELDLQQKIGKYWKLATLIHSNTAKKKGFPNIPGQDVGVNSKWSEEYIIGNLESLMVNVVDKIYEAFPKMQITSGYRAKLLNDSLGSSDSSHHPKGCAIDLQVPGTNTSEVTNWIIDNIPQYAQVIWEKPESSGSWVHIAYQAGANSKKTDVYTAQENILKAYGNKRRGSGRTKYMSIDRARQELV